MLDGSSNPGKQCDGISLGLGFDATAVRLGQRATAPEPVDTCAEGGVTEGGDGAVEASVDASDGGG